MVDARGRGRRDILQVIVGLGVYLMRRSDWLRDVFFTPRVPTRSGTSGVMDQTIVWSISAAGTSSTR